jgi:3-hydroxyisobutyrate dehydrogenase
MSTVAVIGIGRIGAPLVQRLVAAGHGVRAHDVRPGVEDLVRSAGAAWAPALTDATAACDVVFTVLPGSAELAGVVLGPDGLLARLVPGQTWIDLTSAAPDVGARLADAAGARGVGYLDAPIGGGVRAMTDGTVRLYVGGPASVLTGARPVLQAFATDIRYMGGAGAGYLTKLLINTLWFGQAAMTAEALLVAGRAGIEMSTITEALGGSAGDGTFVRSHLPALLRGDYLTDFGLDRCLEELESVRRLADEQALPHPMLTALTDLHRAALENFGPVDGELMAVALLEAQAGTVLRVDRSDGPG